MPAMRKRPYSPVLNPPAQTARLCAIRSKSNVIGTSARDVYNLPQSLSRIDSSVIEFMHATGCRISEVLNIKPTDIAQNGVIKLSAVKGSNDRLVNAGPYNLLFYRGNLALPLISNGYNRFYFYRLFKKLGLYAQIGNREKNSVTHYFRHSMAASLQSANFDEKETALMLGHKKASNSNIYGK